MTNFTEIFSGAEIDRNRDQFVRELLRELAGVLEDAVGLEEAEGFVAIVGNRIGEAMNNDYTALATTDRLDVNQVAGALIDLKRRIDGGFSIESLDKDKIILVNTKCPFGRFVEGRRSLCMMTSNVFGRIAASNLNYARVELLETIAQGDSGCRVVVHFTVGSEGREYFG